MKQEDKDLLLKDLCSRIPYGVKFVIDNDQNNVRTLTGIDEAIPYEDWQMCVFARGISAIPIEDIKPYLFPMSSMTEWQDRELEILMKNSIESCGMLSPYDCLEMERFFNENHIDWRGLIPKGLALDATGLNIY